MRHKSQWLSVLLVLLSFSIAADTFPPNWGGGADASVHYSPAPWPAEPVNAVDCGGNCGDWKPYTRFQNSINDPRTRDPSNGGTAPQNYVNIASSCVDEDLPSVYYYLHQGATAEDDVIMFRWRVEQIANTYATGTNAGSFSASNPWSSALWTVLFDIDGTGYRSLAAHLNGSSGGPSEPIDMLAGIWSNSQKQSIDYINDSAVKLLGHNPTAFIDAASGKVLNFQNSVTPVANWPNGSAETVWDYGTTRARKVSTRSCNEYFVDYQIPVSMLDATSQGGPKITRSTPISMMFCTANSLNNPFQKDCAINKEWAASGEKPAPFGDYVSFDKEEPYSQPIISEVKAVAPENCGQDYQLTAKVQDVLALKNGEVDTSVKAVDFYYWLDTDGSGFADEAGGEWIHATSATRATDSLNTWIASWNSTLLPKGRYLIGVQALDDNTVVDDNMVATGVDNRTFSYVAGDIQTATQDQIYVDGAWIAAQQASFPSHSPSQTPIATENWYGNPEVTGIQTALVGQAINTCGVAPKLILTADKSEVAPAGTVTFTITVSNAGNPNAITVSNLTDVLPDGFSYQNTTSGGDFGSVDPTISGQTLSWDFTPITVSANASASLSFASTASSISGNYNDTATSITSFGLLASNPVPIAVGVAGLSLSITPDVFNTTPGGQVTYTLTYSNPSTVAIDNTTLSVVLPANTSSTGNISWSLGTLNPGASGTVTLVLDVGAGYTSNSLTIPATITGIDPGANSVTATAQSTIYVNVPLSNVAAFTLDKIASDVQIAPGANTTYTLSYFNYGSVAASNVVISDTLPAGMLYVSSSPVATSAPAVDSNGSVSWDIGSVAGNSGGSVSLTVKADTAFASTDPTINIYPNPTVNAAEINWDGGSPVIASHSVGISGQSCNAYYFRDSTISINSSNQRIANTVAPTAATAPTVSIAVTTTPQEAVRFYQDPPNTSETIFSGDLTTSFYISKPSGPQLKMDVSVYDFDPATPASNGVLLGSGSFSQTGSGTNQLFSFVTPLNGTLAKEHRLLWVFDAYSNQTSTFTLHFDGVSSQSRADFCVEVPASLSINKTVNSASVPENTVSALTYTISYNNTGSSDATNAVIVETLPTGVSFTSATLNGSSITPTGSGPYTFALGTVAAASEGTLLINASVSNTATGLLTNSASLSSDQTSTVTDTADTLVGTPNSGSGGSTAPELYIEKISNVSSLGANEAVTYTLTVVNAGNADATSVVVTDDFPDQTYFIYQQCDTTDGSCSSDTTTLNWNIGTLAAGASATLTYQMKTTAAGLPNGLTQLDNIAVVSDDNYCTGGTPPASCSSHLNDDKYINRVTVSGNPELTLTLTANKASVVPSDLIEYTVVVTNTGSSTANELVTTNPIPDKTGFVEITSGTGSFDTINNRLLFPIASLVSGASVTYTFSVKVVSPLASGNTTLTDTATVTAANAASASDTVVIIATAAPVMSLSLTGPNNVPLPATTLATDVNNSISLTVASAALLQPGNYIRVNGTFALITAIAGDIVTLNTPVTATSGTVIQLAAKFSISYQNTGNAAATNVQIIESLTTADWLYIASTPTASSKPVVGGNGFISWSLGTVNAGGSGNLQFVALPTISGSFPHTATLSASALTDVQANHTVLIGGLIVDKSVASEISEPGGQATYTITLQNSLSSPVNGVIVKDLLSAGFTYASSSTAPSSFESGDQGRPIWTVDVPANGSTSITFTVDISADLGAATYQNEVEVIAPAGVGVVNFDALATTAEDVTLLSGAGLISGYVKYDLSPMSGIAVNFYENNLLAYRTFTDNSGRYQQVLEVGNNWRIEIASDVTNDTFLSALTLATGIDPENFSVVSGDSIIRNFVYSLNIGLPPVAVDDTAFSAVNSSVIIPVLDNDSDPDATALNVTAVTNATNGTVVINADNTITYTPSSGFSGTDSFTYTITDADGLTDTAIVTITIVAAPVITLPADILIDATGLFTKVDLGTATAVDYQGKPLPVSVVDGVTFYWSGNNEAIWKATDENGLTSTATQAVRVRPLVSFSKDQTVAEGSTVTLKVVLNGPSPVYPVNVSYTVTGTATNPDDHDLISGTAVISSGIETTITINTIDDGFGEGDETIVLSMDDPSLNQGVQNSHSIILSEENVAPSVRLDVVQNSLDRLTVAQTEGQVVVTSTVSDPNLADTHSYDWSLSNNVLVDVDTDDTTFTFDPSNLTEGVYEVWVNVTDDGVPAKSNIARVFIKVVATLPVLTTIDSDNDGIADNIEGFADNDRDGIPDYLDSISECNVLAEQGLIFNGYLIESDPGVCSRIGNDALLGVSGGTQILDQDINKDLTDDLIPDPEATNVGGIFDFIITQIPDNSQSVNIVIPQRLAVPANAVYRKLNNGVWFTFIEDSRNKVWSTAGEPGYCPPPGSAVFQQGLTEGHWCVQITIEDGGPNDDDGQVNRSIIDPGGVGVLNRITLTTSGGGALSLWTLLLLLGTAGLRARRMKKYFSVLIMFCLLMFSVSAKAVQEEHLPAAEIKNIEIAEKIVKTGDTVKGEVATETDVAKTDEALKKETSVSVEKIVTVDELGGNVSKLFNTTPFAKDDNAITDQKQELFISVLENDTDADGDELKIIHAEAEHGTVSIDNNKLRYLPHADFYGKDKITYIIFDGQGSVPSELSKKGIAIDQLCEGDTLCGQVSKGEKISLRLQINFANNDATVTKNYYSEIKKLVDVMAKVPAATVTVEGHTSVVGSARYNQKLSERRAASVAKVLSEHFNIDPLRVKSVGYGENQLLNKENTEQAHSENRRIIVVFDASFIKKIKKDSGVSIATVAVEVIKQNSWYVWADAGVASTSTSIGALNNEINNNGINATVTSFKNSRTAAQFGVGYRLNDRWAFELGYADLGEVEITLTTTETNLAQLYNDISKIHPLSSKGYLLATQYHWNFTKDFDMLFRLGYWIWDADYKTYNVSAVGDDSLDGGDFIFGVGLSYQLIDSLEGRVLLQRFNVGNSTASFISAGLTYNF